VARGRKAGTKNGGPKYDRPIQCNVTEETEKALADLSVKEQRSISAIVRQAVTEYLERRDSHAETT
jgi:predicted transcriptional regulator